MEMDYRQAMDQLQSMFPQFDSETIRTVLASNDGHVERTIDDLFKLAEDVEKDDADNLFADDYKPSVSNHYGGGSYHDNKAAKSIQEEEDAKLAYQLQMQYMKQEQNQPGPPGQREQHHPPQPDRRSYERPAPLGAQDPNLPDYGYHYNKKPGFYKKLKLSLKNLLTKKGKSGKHGVTRNPGVYNVIEPLDENTDNDNLNGLNGGYNHESLVKNNENQEREASPMKLSDVLGKESRNRNYENHDKVYDNFYKGYDNRNQDYENRPKDYENRPSGYDNYDKNYNDRYKVYDDRAKNYDSRHKNYDDRDKNYGQEPNSPESPDRMRYVPLNNRRNEEEVDDNQYFSTRGNRYSNY